MNSLTDKEINRASDGIDKALSTATRSNRGEVAFRILSVVRNLNDHIAFKIWKDVRPDQKMDINKVASKFGNVRPYQFIARFDHFLRASVSHFTPSEEGAERLMIKYYRYLLQLKKAVYDRYGMIILRNIDMFLEDLDEQTKDYYQKVATEIEKRLRTPPPKNFDNYYIDKIKPFFVNQEIYYEVALEPADEKPNKFNRITAFTKYDISTDYCVALSFSNATISVFNTDFPIKIITEWHVSIRPCELNNFAELLNVECSVSRGLNEYMVAAVVVVLASAVVGVLAAVPNISQGCHGGGFSVVQPFQESGVNRAAVAADAASVEVQCACQEVFVACHDVCEVPKGLGRVPLGTDMNVNAAAPCGIAFGSSFAQVANQLLQGFHVSVGEDRRDHLAFFAVRSCDADILLEFPLASALIPSRPGAVAVAASGVLVPSGTEEGGCQPCGLLSGDAVHFDLDPDGLLLHFGYLVFCSLAHVCDLRFGSFSLLVVTYYL